MPDPFVLRANADPLGSVIDERISLADRVRADVSQSPDSGVSLGVGAAGGDGSHSPPGSLTDRVRRAVLFPNEPVQGPPPNGRSIDDTPRGAYNFRRVAAAGHGLDIAENQIDPVHAVRQGVEDIQAPVTQGDPEPANSEIPLPTQTPELAPVDVEGERFLRDRRLEAHKAAGVARNVEQDRQEFAESQPSLARSVLETVGLAKPQPTGFMPEPGGRPIPAPGPPGESSVGEQFATPIKNRIVEIYSKLTLQDNLIASHAEEIVEREAATRRIMGLYEPRQVVRMTGRDRYENASPQVQEHLRGLPNFSELLQSSWYEAPQGQRSLEDDIHQELLNGLSMVDETARHSQIEYYKRLKKIEPDQIPEARGFFQKLAGFGGHMAPFVAEIMAFKKFPGVKGLGKRVAKGAGGGFGRAVEEGAAFGLRGATVEGANPYAEAAFGAALGGTQAVGGAAAVRAGKPAFVGQASATGALFGGEAAVQPGSTATDVLIAGGLVPLMFHAKDVIRWRFQPRGLAKRYGFGDTDKLPNDWRGLRDRPDPASKLIYRWSWLGDRNPEAVNEIRGTGQAIGRLYEQYQNSNWRGVEPTERIILETFVKHYDPANVVDRAGPAGSRRVGTPAEPSRPTPEPSIPREPRRATPDVAQRPTGKRGGQQPPGELPTAETIKGRVVDKLPEKKPGEIVNGNRVQFWQPQQQKWEIGWVHGRREDGSFDVKAESGGMWTVEDIPQSIRLRPSGEAVSLDRLQAEAAETEPSAHSIGGPDQLVPYGLTTGEWVVRGTNAETGKDFWVGARGERIDVIGGPRPVTGATQKFENRKRAEEAIRRWVEHVPETEPSNAPVGADGPTDTQTGATPPSEADRRSSLPPKLREKFRKGIRKAKADVVEIYNRHQDVIVGDEPGGGFVEGDMVDAQGDFNPGESYQRPSYTFREDGRGAGEAREMREALREFGLEDKIQIVEPGHPAYAGADGADAMAIGTDQMIESVKRFAQLDPNVLGLDFLFADAVENPLQYSPEDLYKITKYRVIVQSPEMAEEARGTESSLLKVYDFAEGDTFTVAGQLHRVDTVGDDWADISGPFERIELPREVEVAIDKGSWERVDPEAPRPTVLRDPDADPAFDDSFGETTPEPQTQGIIEQETTGERPTGQIDEPSAATTTPDRPGAGGEVLAGGAAGGVPATGGKRPVGELPAGAVEPGGGRPIGEPRKRPGSDAGERADEGDVVPTIGSGATTGPRKPRPGRIRPGDGADAGPAGAGGEPDTGVPDPEITEADPRPRPRKPTAGKPTKTDYVIQPDEVVFQPGEVNRTNLNIAAIRLIKQIDERGTPATAEERRALVQYSGWGSNRGVFDKGRWGHVDTPDKKRYEELKALLTDEEMDAAAESTPYAMFTPPEIIRDMWTLIEGMGFTSGKILEPGAGVGHFFGAMPEHLIHEAQRVAVEKDAISGRITQELYPRSKVMITPYQKAGIPDNYFDVVIGNVPFQDVMVADRRYPSRVRSQLHDYYFVRSLAVTRPGGIVAFITSKGTMDKLDPAVRRYLGEQADMVGAVRLNNEALSGTKVTADIIVLQKRRPGDKVAGPKWLESTAMEVRNPDTDSMVEKHVNEYFQQHPENVLGEIVAGSMYSGRRQGPTETIVIPSPEKGTTLAKVFEGFREVAIATQPIDSTIAATTDELVAAPDNLPPGAYGIGVAGELRQVMRDKTMGAIEDQIISDELEKAAAAKSPRKLARGRAIRKIERIRGMVRIRDRVLDFQRAMLKGSASEEELNTLQKALNDTYDWHTRKNNALHSQANVGAVRDDGFTSTIVQSIEHYNKTTKKAKKGMIFTRRVLEPQPEQLATTIDEALAVSLDRTAGGAVDVNEMARILGRDAKDVLAEAVEAGLVYELPDSRNVTADEFLSGDSRGKLEEMEAAAKLDPKFERNVEAIRNIIPEDLTQADIKVQIGQAWIPIDFYNEFANHLFGEGLIITYSEPTGKFFFADKSSGGKVKARLAATDTWGTGDVDGVKLLKNAIENKKPVVRRTKADNSGTYVDEGATELAALKLRQIAEEFERWVWADPDRVTDLLPIYNRHFNTLVPRTFSGDHLQFPGMSPVWKAQLRPYQRRKVWRMIAGRGNMMAAQAVGSGKTAEMAAIAMELTRRGMARKVVAVVQGATYHQFPAEARDMYPAGKIYQFGDKAHTGRKRIQALANIAFGDWDLVIMTHDSFKLIPMGAETTNAYFKQQVDALEDAIIEAKAAESKQKGGRESPLVRDLETRKARLEAKLEERLGKIEELRRLGGVFFEDMGIDWILYDEAHTLKNLAYTNSGDRLKGLGPPDGNEITDDAKMKIEHVQRLQNGRGVGFFTGTPITNSITEMFNIQRFLQPDAVNANNIDAWLRNWGHSSTDVEASVEGAYREQHRLRTFINVGDLMRQWRDLVDTVTTKELVEKYGVVLPKLAKNSQGKHDYELIVTPLDPAMKKYLKAIERYAEDIRKDPIGMRDQGDTFLRVTHLMRTSALDLRLASRRAVEGENNKLSTLADEVAEMYRESTGIDLTKLGRTIDELDEIGANHREGKVDGLQLIFMDVGVNPTDWGFSPYQDLVQKLIDRGVKREEIAIIQEHDKTLEDLFEKANRGEIRVLLGSIKKMGIGVNVQKLAYGIHFTVPPWTPAMFEQGEGRVIRSGNLFLEVKGKMYLTERIDEFFYDVLLRKTLFIDQVRKGTLDVREIDVPSDEALRGSEIRQITSGNPHVIPHERQKRVVAQLTAERSGHAQQIGALRHKLMIARMDVSGAQKAIPRLEKHVDYIRGNSPEKFGMQIGDEFHVKRDVAGQILVGKLGAIWDKYIALTSGEQWSFAGSEDNKELLAHYRGHEVYARPSLTQAVMVWLESPAGKTEGFAVLGAEIEAGEVSARGLSQRLDHWLAYPESTLGENRQRVKTKQAEVDELNKRLASTEWDKAGELEDARAELSDLKTKMMAFKDTEGPGEDLGDIEDLSLGGGSGGGGGSSGFPPGPAKLQPGNLLPSSMTAEQKRHFRHYLDPTKPNYVMGAMANIPDARNWWKRSVDDFVDRLTHIPIDSRAGRAFHRYVGRGLIGGSWGISEPLFGYRRRVQGAKRLARFDSEAVYGRWLDRRKRKLQHDLGATDGGAGYRSFEKTMTEVIEGETSPDVLDKEAREWFDNLKKRIDGITEETLLFDETYLSAFGLENIHEVIRERMRSTGTHLRALYQPAQQTIEHQIDERGKLIIGIGPRLQGSGWKPRRSDEGIKHRETWTLYRAGGKVRQFFDPDTAQDAYEKEIKDNIKHYGESVYERVELRDSFDRKMVASLAPIDDLGIRIAATLTAMEHNLATLKLFDYIATTHAVAAEEGSEGEAPIANYVHVPEHPTFGPLSNTWVNHHVWQNLMAHDVVHRSMMARVWSLYNYVWKTGKTIPNAGTWVNNWLGDTLFAAFYGISPVTHPTLFIRAGKEIAAGRAGKGMEGEGPGSVWRYLVSENRMNTGFFGNFYDEYAERGERNGLFGADDFGLSERAAEILHKAIDVTQRTTQKVGQAYDYADQINIMAAFLNMTDPPEERGKGMPREEAVEELYGFPNYDEVGNLFKWLSNSPIGSSFAKFIGTSLKILLRQVRNHPGILMALYALPGLMNTMTSMILGISDEEWAVINSDPRRSGSWAGERFMERYFQPLLPLRGENGRLKSVDLRWSFPLANDFRVDTGPGGYAFPLIWNTPLTRAVGEMQGGHDLFTGRRVTPRESEGQQKFVDHMLNAIEELEPTPRMLTRTWRELWDVLQNDTEDAWWVALARGVFGAKIKEVRPSRQGVIKAMREQFGDDAVLSWSKMASLYNTTYRREGSRPINPRSVIRGKVVRDARELQYEQQRETARERVRRGKARR